MVPGEPDADERAGELIGGRYRLVGRLGAGGFGRVWKAHDTTLGVDVAVKEVWLPPTMSRRDQDERLARAQREARNAARLRDHPNVVGIHDVVVHDDVPWTVMQLVAGRSLDEQVRVHGPLPPQQVVTVARALLKALGAAHAAGIVHRDVKPANVLLSDEGEVLLADFGIAVQQADTALTATGAFLGSVEYIAPERARGTDGLPGSDLFSLGVTLYHALEGFSPFRRDTPTGTLSALLFEEAPPPTRAGTLTPLIAALLEKDPERRVTNAQALALVEQAADPRWRPAAETQVAKTQVAETQVTMMPAPPRVEPAPQAAGAAPTLSAAPAAVGPAAAHPTVAAPSADFASASALAPTPGSVPVPGQRRAWIAAGVLGLLGAGALALPARSTYYDSYAMVSYLHDDRLHSFPLAIIAVLFLAATVAILSRLATVRTAGLRLTGYLCAGAGLVYWLYRLLSLQDVGDNAWFPFSSDARVGVGMWLMVLVAAGLMALYTRRERTTRHALGVRLFPGDARRLSQRSSVASAAGVGALMAAALGLPSRERNSFVLTTYDFMGDRDAQTVPHQLLRTSLALSLLALVALCILPRIKSRVLRGAPYVLAGFSALCWTYQLIRLHDYDIRYSGGADLGIGAWLMVLGAVAVLALYGWRENTTRDGKDTPAHLEA